MHNSEAMYLTARTYTHHSGQSFIQFCTIFTDLALIYTDLYRNLQMFADLPATRPMMQPSYTAATYANSTVIKTTQRAWIPRARSVKTRRNPLSDNKLYLQTLLNVIARSGSDVAISSTLSAGPETRNPKLETKVLCCRPQRKRVICGDAHVPAILLEKQAFRPYYIADKPGRANLWT